MQTVIVLVTLLLDSVFNSLLISSMLFSETSSVECQVFLGRQTVECVEDSLFSTLTDIYWLTDYCYLINSQK